MAFTTVYDAIGYDLILDYTKPCEVLLKGKAAAWTARQVAAWKARIHHTERERA
jgi:predicted DNA-binding transcriptional regulator AlpA